MKELIKAKSDFICEEISAEDAKSFSKIRSTNSS